MKSYLKKSLCQFEPYIPGEQPLEKGWIKLNTNENPYPPSPKVFQSVRNELNNPLQKYPDPVSTELRRTIAELYKLDISRVLVGNGSDEILRIILETFLDRGENVVYPYPSYPLYKTLTGIHDGRLLEIQLTEDFDLPDWKISWQGKILFIANPNSPTGGLFNNKKIARLCEIFKGIIVLDEAYVDFADSSGLPLLKRYNNLIISRSLSKSYSLAGLRIGVAFAAEDLIQSMNLVKDSYNLNRISQVAGIAALKDQKYFYSIRGRILNTRTRLIKELNQYRFHTYPSQSNFIFTSPPNRNAKSLYQYLKRKKILIRYWDLPRLRDGLRITVGTDNEIDRLLYEIKIWMKEN